MSSYYQFFLPYRRGRVYNILAFRRKYGYSFTKGEELWKKKTIPIKI